MKVYVFPPFFSVLRELIKLLGKIPRVANVMHELDWVKGSPDGW